MARSRRLGPALVVALIGIGFGTAASLEAQAASPPGGARPDFGTKDRILTHIGYTEFQPDDSFTTYAGGFTGLRYSMVPRGFFEAVAHVPSGAFLTYLELDYCDTSAGSDHVTLDLMDCVSQTAGCTIIKALSSADGVFGCGSVSADITSLSYTMDNKTHELVLVCIMDSGDTKNELLGAYLGYKLQVSAAPATPTFGDVPTSYLYFRAIEALAASGITGGCGNGNFCPNQSITRGEIAAFFARALGLHFPD